MNRQWRLGRTDFKGMLGFLLRGVHLHGSRAVLAVMLVTYTIGLSLLALMRFYTFRTYLDLGIFDQAFSSTLKGHLFYETPDLSKIPTGSFLGTHFAPLIFLLLPVYAIHPGPETLLVLQTPFIAFGALPVYLFSRHLLRNERISLALAGVYLMNPAVQSLNLFDFHLEAFLPFFLGMAYYFMFKRRWKPYFLFLGLSLITIEFAAIIIVAMSVATVLSYRGKLKDLLSEPKKLLSREMLPVSISLVTILVAGGEFFLSLELSAIFAGTHASPPTLLGGFFPDFQQWVDAGFRYKIVFWIVLVGGLLFLPLKAPTGVLLAAPWFLVTLITTNPVYYYVGYQYGGAFAAPYLIIAFVNALHMLGPALRAKGFLISTFTCILLFSTIVTPLSPWAQHSLPGIAYEEGFSFKGVRRSLRATPTSLLAILIIAIALSAAIARVSITGQFLPTSIGSTLNGNTLTTQASFVVTTGNLPLQLNLLAAPITSLGADRPVFLYYDPRYPTLGNDPRGWIGILDHLPAELRLRGYTGQIQTVNASGLRVAMTQNFTSVIVIPSGVFPTTVQNATGGLVGNWLRSGGTLVWMGGTFGYYSAVTSEQTLDPLVTDMSPGVGSQTRILGYPLISVPINGTARIATTATSFSSALNLTYSDVWVAPTLGFLKSVGGLAIGHLQNSTDTSRSSVSLVPVGLGKLILFGGPVTSLMTADGEDVVSHDLAQILSLGDTISPAVVKYATFNLPANTSTSIRFTASFNVTSSKVGGLVIAAFSDYGFSRLYWRTQLGV